MNRRRFAFAAAVLMVVMALSGCDATPAPIEPDTGSSAVDMLPGNATPVPEGEPTPAPEEHEEGEYELITKNVYFPEGSTQSEASYTLSYTLPRFFGNSIFAANSNGNIALFEEELLERAQEQYLPTALESEDAGHTEVSVQVICAREYTNILISERNTFGDVTSDTLSTLVLDASGLEQSLADIALAGTYDIDSLVAQLVYNRMDQERDKYFGDLSLADIAACMDLYNRYYVTNAGYIVYFADGTIAPEAEGPILMELSEQDLYPAFVGDVLSKEVYVSVSPLLDTIGYYALDGFESFEGAPSPRVAAGFLYERILSLEEPLDALLSWDGDTRVIAASDLEALFESYFTASYPGDYALPEGMVQDSGIYRITQPASGVLPSANARVLLTDAEQGDTESSVLLSGSLLLKVPGVPEPETVSGVRIKLLLDDAAPEGFRIASFSFTR